MSVEHFIRNEKVVGSSPTFGSGAGDGTGESLSRFFLLAYSFIASANLGKISRISGKNFHFFSPDHALIA